MPAVVQPDVSSTMQFPVAGTSRDVYRCGVRWGMGAALVLTGRGRVAMHQPLRRGHRRLARSDAASGVAASADASASPAHDSDNGVTTEVAMDTLGPASRDAADSDAKGAQQVTRPAKVRSGGASAAAPEPSHAAQTITDCAPQGLDSLALRDTATRADPFIPGTMTASQQVAVAVQVGTILFTGGLWVWLYTTHGNSAPLVNAQMGALLANSMCMSSSMPLLNRFYSRGSYTWLYRRAFAEAAVETVERHDRLMSRLTGAVAVSSPAFAVISPALLMINTTLPAWSDTWWLVTYMGVPTLALLSQFCVVIIPLLSLNIMLSSLFQARVRWLRTETPARSVAIQVMWEMDYVLTTMSREVAPPLVGLMLFAAIDIGFMALFLVENPITNWAMAMVVPMCCSAISLIVFLEARVSKMARMWTQEFFLVFDSLPERGETDDLDVASGPPDDVQVDAGPPHTWLGFVEALRVRPLAMRMLGATVTYESLLRVGSVLLGALSLVVRAVLLNETSRGLNR